MDTWITKELIVSKLNLVCYVAPGNGLIVHRNRPSHGFAIKANGSNHYRFSDGTTLTVNPGDIIYLPKYSNYTVSALESGDCYAINFDLIEDLVNTPFVFTPKSFSSLLEKFKQAEHAWTKRKSGYSEQCLSLLYSILSVLKQEFSEQNTPSSGATTIQPAVKYINEHYYFGEEIRISELAELCGISQPYLRRLFQTLYHTTPTAYINQLRLVRAAELIDSGMYSVHDAAELSGFLDDSYFSRAFKKAYGMSPIQYKRRTVR